MVEQRPFKALAAGSSPAQPIALIFEHFVAASEYRLLAAGTLRGEGKHRALFANVVLVLMSGRPKHLRLQSEITPLLVFCIDAACMNRYIGGRSEKSRDPGRTPASKIKGSSVLVDAS